MTFFLPEYGVYLTAAALYTSFAAVIMALFRRLTGSRFSSGWRYVMSIIIPIIVLIPLRFYFPWSLIRLPQYDAPIYIPPTSSQPSDISQIQKFSADDFPDKMPISVMDVLAAVILITAAVLFIREIILNITLKRQINRSGNPCTNDEIIPIYEKICSDMKQKPVPLIICGIYNSPFAMGIFRPKIVLPTEEYSESELEFILRHELVHIKRHDVFVKLMLMMFRCLNWYNPLAHMLYRQACEDMEISCDEAACRSFSSEKRQNYCKTILKGITKGKCPAMTTCLGAGAVTMKKRLACVLEENKISNLLPFFGAFTIILMFTLVSYVTPAYCLSFTFNTPYPTEKIDLSLSDNSWKTCTADSYYEAAEKIFTQYMALYTGEDVPDYQRIEAYCIDEIQSHEYHTNMNSMTGYVKNGLLNRGKMVEVTYSFITANKCGNTVHNTNRGYMKLDGMTQLAKLDMEITRSNNTYTLQSMGVSNTFMVTDKFHFSSEIYKEFGYLKRWQDMAESGLFDNSWDTENPPSLDDLLSYDYKQFIELNPPENYSPGYIYEISIHDLYPDLKDSELWDGEKIHAEKIIELNRNFEYCGYNADIESGDVTFFGNITDEKESTHGIILNYRHKESGSKYTGYMLKSVEVTEETFTPAAYNDSFEKLTLPEEIYTDKMLKTAENILEYMKTPRNGSDFTVQDYKNLSEKQGMAFAEVKFKGRLCGKYSSELGEDEYIYVKVCG